MDRLSDVCPKSDLDPRFCSHCKDKRDGLTRAEIEARDASIPGPNASIGLSGPTVSEELAELIEACHADEGLRRGKFGRGKRRPGHGD